MTTTLRIKNMVCDRCVRTVERQMAELGLSVTAVSLGEVEVEHSNALDFDLLAKKLRSEGFDLVEDRKAALVERVKGLIIEMVQHGRFEAMRTNLSTYLSSELGKDYHYLSTLFSQVENVTIEKFVILQKIERAKELLTYDEKTLGEIARTLGYSSVSYLSAQFKQVTGFTPSEFKKLKSHHRVPLDEVLTEAKGSNRRRTQVLRTIL